MKEKKKVKMEAIEEWIHKYFGLLFCRRKISCTFILVFFLENGNFFMIRISFLILVFIFILIKTIKIKKLTYL